MAAGDPVEISTSISGSSTATITISNTTVLSDFPTNQHDGAGFNVRRHDGTNSADNAFAGGAGNSPEAPRMVFDSHDLDVENEDCSSKRFMASGREI